AARFGQILDLKEAVADGADVNSSDPTQGGKGAMHWAAEGGYTKIIKFLADLGADVKCRDNDLQTPLHLAAGSGHVPAIQQLVQLGAEVNASNRAGFTPLHWASANGHPRAVLALLELGACQWCVDWQGRTALQLADYWNQ
ncbi:hypothetical protein GUITHDRAFT_41422, partial [Guillardia theta CCMP2712]